MTRVLISGGWDLMHYNHVLILRHAKSLGDWLTVHCVSDERMRLKKGEDRPFMKLRERIEVLEELRCVDEVITVPGDHYPLFDAIDMAKPDIVLINVTENPDISKERAYCAERGIKLVEVERINEGVSTSALLARMKKAAA